MKRSFKLFYSLTLGALCLVLTASPAGATTVGGAEIAYTAIARVNGSSNLTWTTAPAWESPGSGSIVKLDGTASCAAGVDGCWAAILFGVNVNGVTPITVTLGGTSTDPYASGWVDFDATVTGTGLWSVKNGSLSMTPFIVQILDPDMYSGDIMIYMAAGTVVDLGGESLDFSIGTPEPGSALLLGASLALVAFLRRRIRG